MFGNAVLISRDGPYVAYVKWFCRNCYKT